MSDTPTDPALLRGLIQRRLSRRQLLRSAGVGVSALSLGAILGACSEGAKTGSGIDWSAKPDGVLNFANWPLYIDVNRNSAGRPVHTSLQEFTQKTDIRVNYREVILDNQEFIGKIEPLMNAGDPTGFDLMVITNGPTLDLLKGRGFLVELPKNIRPEFDKNASTLVKNPSYDPGNRYTMAWQSGITGIGWDPKLVAKLRPSKPTVTSWADLWDPAFKGKVGMFGDLDDLPNSALIAIGKAPETSTVDDWKAAAAHLNKQKSSGVVRGYYSQNYINALTNGETALTMAWSGDIYQSNLKGTSNGLQFDVPKEGAIIWTDNMCIPVGVLHPVDAMTYMNYVYQPSIAAQIEQYVNYICPVPESKVNIEGMATADATSDPSESTRLSDLAKSPLVYPSESYTASLHRYYSFKNDDEQATWAEIFSPIFQK